MHLTSGHDEDGDRGIARRKTLNEIADQMAVKRDANGISANGLVPT